MRVVFACLLLVVLTCHPARAYATDPCAEFAWDVGHERALFATTPETVAAGTSAESAPLLAVERLYRLTLTPQERVDFAVAPERKRSGDAPYAGLARLHIAVAGTYRLALSRPYWVDIVQSGSLISSSGFTGSHGCEAPRKIVQYTLAAGDFVLQVSGAGSADVGLTLTAAPGASH